MSVAFSPPVALRFLEAVLLFVLFFHGSLALADTFPETTLPPTLVEMLEYIPAASRPLLDAEGFLSEDAGKEYFYEDDEAGRYLYLHQNLCVIISRYRDESIPLEWFETDIRTRNYERFRTVFSDPENPGLHYQFPYTLSRQAGFVLGFSDDFFADRVKRKVRVGVVLRNGQLLTDSIHPVRNHFLPNLDMMALFPDGSCQVYEANEITGQELLTLGAVNVLSFGPILIRDGQIDPIVEYYKALAPRQALGMIEPNHFFLLTVLGRRKDSAGSNLLEMSRLMLARGVTQALNLDGGNTVALVFRGRMLNKLGTYNNQTFVRTVPSLLGIGYTESMPAD